LGEPESSYMHLVPTKHVRVMGPRPEGHDLAGKPHRLAPADGLVGDGNVGVDEAVSQLGLTQVTVHWLFPRYLLLNHLRRMLCPVTHAHITAHDTMTRRTVSWGGSSMRAAAGRGLGERVGEPCEVALIQRYSPQLFCTADCFMRSFLGLDLILA